jgi:hypothetical protein
MTDWARFQIRVGMPSFDGSLVQFNVANETVFERIETT